MPADVLPGFPQTPMLAPPEKHALGHDWPVPTQAVQPPPAGNDTVFGNASAIRLRSHVVTLAPPNQMPCTTPAFTSRNGVT